MRSSTAIADISVRPLLALLAFCGGSAIAYPDASPWGAANPDADETCSDCHYDYEPVRDSAAIDIVGMPGTATPGQAYEIVVRMTGVDAAVSGFQLIATGGAFAASGGTLETTETAVRSTRAAANDGNVEWTISWRAPAKANDAVDMYLAVAASNDDQSPLGDTIHYRRFVVRVTLP